MNLLSHRRNYSGSPGALPRSGRTRHASLAARRASGSGYPGSTIHHRPVSEGGIAMVIVMISIFVLSILAGGFAYSMKVETRLARNANSETELEWLGRSAI